MGQIDDAFEMTVASVKTDLNRLRERLKIDGVDELTAEQINQHHSMAWKAGYNKAWDAAIRAQCQYCNGLDSHLVDSTPTFHEGGWRHEAEVGAAYWERWLFCNAYLLHEERRKEGG